MSIFYCAQCDQLRDSDDGAEEHPSDPRVLICVDCAIELEEIAEEARAFTAARYAAEAHANDH